MGLAWLDCLDAAIVDIFYASEDDRSVVYGVYLGAKECKGCCPRNTLGQVVYVQVDVHLCQQSVEFEVAGLERRGSGLWVGRGDLL